MGRKAHALMRLIDRLDTAATLRGIAFLSEQTRKHAILRSRAQAHRAWAPVRVINHGGTPCVGGTATTKPHNGELHTALYGSARDRRAQPRSPRADLMSERGIEVDHSSVHRWVIKLVPLFEKAFRKCKRPVGKSWRRDETYGTPSQRSPPAWG